MLLASGAVLTLGRYSMLDTRVPVWLKASVSTWSLSVPRPSP